MMIPCLCSFTVPSSPSAELPTNKKRTQTLSHRESGSSTNCMVGAGGFEPPKLKAADLQSVPIGHSGTRPYSIRSLTDCLYILPLGQGFVNVF